MDMELMKRRHSAAHLMAWAVTNLFEDVQLDIGPPTQDGFYYDFDMPHRLVPDDLPVIEKEMRRLKDRKDPFVLETVARDEAEKRIAAMGQKYKVERLADIPEDEEITFYTCGDFVDLCRGPHTESTNKVGSFKLLSIAGSYYRGDEKNTMLQRLYGTAFANDKQLKVHLKRIEEAKKRDHKVLGRQLQLFHIDDQVGQGLILWTPKGAIIRRQLQTFIADELEQRGYYEVFTPHIGKLGLYRTSGHFPYYQDSQYPPIVNRETLQTMADEGCTCADLANRLVETGDDAIDGYLLKPMNCPHHIKIYSSQPRSYRDLPVRLCEFGTVYRWEQSGEIGGLTRVRGFTQDDAHLFCTEDQLQDEIIGCLDLVKLVFRTLGMDDFRIRIGLRDDDQEKYTGDPENWKKAEQACRDAAASLDMPFTEEVGEAAFYGPKIDFVVNDAIGREWQLGTIQVDYSLPLRFDLTYTGADGHAHTPVIIHRAPFGSMERFVGVLIEHFGGVFPTWLAPEQARVMNISAGQNAYAAEVEKLLRDARIRVSYDSRSDPIGAKIKRARPERIPYLVVVGDREMEAGQVAARHRSHGELGPMTVSDLIDRIHQDIRERRID